MIRYGYVLEADQALALALSRKLKRYKVNSVQGACKNTFADLTATIKVLDVQEVFDLTTSEPVLFHKTPGDVLQISAAD